MITNMFSSWYFLRIFWKKQPELRVFGFFGCHQKTLSLGLPLINAIYEKNPKIGYYTLPLLIWHPM
jgi:sodium/bile acid cotransporter 7